jgi:hypothetical protein
MNKSTLLRWIAVPAAAAGLLAGLLAGCGSSAKKATAPAVTTTAAAATTTTAAASNGTTTTTAAAQKITITPQTGLKDGQVVHVVATGFTPNESLGVNECGDKGTSTAAGDCNLGKIQVTKSDANGTVTADFPVVKGPFGANAIVCSATQKCLVSVSQLTQTQTENASDNITFA